jgi:hypothetical protein
MSVRIVTEICLPFMGSTQSPTLPAKEEPVATEVSTTNAAPSPAPHGVASSVYRGLLELQRAAEENPAIPCPIVTPQLQ